MKTCLSILKRNSIWQECKLTLLDMGFDTVYENESNHRISARKFNPGSSHTLLMDICISFQMDMVVLSVEIVQNSEPDGMLSRQKQSELAFLHKLLFQPNVLQEENAFRIR